MENRKRLETIRFVEIMSNWKFDKNAEVNLKKLLTIQSPSSMEMQTALSLRNNWRELGLDVKTDLLGNIYGTLNPSKNFTIGIVAHMDVVSIQITKILDNGLLLFRRIGSSLYSLIGRKVSILSQKGNILGVIGYDPLKQNCSDKLLQDEDLWLDIGVESKTEALALIEIGDFAVYEPHYCRIGENKICSSGLDDRIGLFIATEVLKEIVQKSLDISICIIGSVQEEIGLRGAQIIGNNKQMDACLIIDVDYATDIPTNIDKQIGELILGKGIGLCRKSDNNKILQSLIKDVAENKKRSYQINLGRNISGGTDAATLQLQLSGIATTNISIPCRYMHSSNEICDIRDVEAAVNILISSIEYINGQNKLDFTPKVN